MSVISISFGEQKGIKGIIAFDLDDTLVNKSNNLPCPGVIQKLQNHINEGWNIVVFSNQKKRSIGDIKLKTRLELICHTLNIPLTIYCAREDDIYRKPNTGMVKLSNKLGKISMFIGDAAGRVGDHSDCDLQFAKNINVPFETPEKYFALGDIVDRNILPSILKNNIIEIATMVILIGTPASGKSRYVKTILSEYVSISRDELKTMPKCIKACEEVLKNDKLVVIDNLNSTIQARTPFIALAKKYDYRVVGIHMATSFEQAMVWNETREHKVPKIVFYKYRKEFQEPTIDEGFDQILTVL